MESNSSNRMVWIIGAVIALVLGGVVVYAVMNNSSDKQEQTTPANESATIEEPQQETTEEAEKPDAVATQSTTITFKNDGFSPNSLTVKAGSKVIVKNESSQDVQFSSDDHPTHTGQSELNLPVIAPGESASFTPTKVGSWGFHDHINDSLVGTLKVTE